MFERNRPSVFFGALLKAEKQEVQPVQEAGNTRRRTLRRIIHMLHRRAGDAQGSEWFRSAERFSRHLTVPSRRDGGEGEIYYNRKLNTRRSPRDPALSSDHRAPLCNENWRLMASMFYQQLINRKTFPHDGPFQIPLRDRGI